MAEKKELAQKKSHKPKSRFSFEGFVCVHVVLDEKKNIIIIIMALSPAKPSSISSLSLSETAESDHSGGSDWDGHNGTQNEEEEVDDEDEDEDGGGGDDRNDGRCKMNGHLDMGESELLLTPSPCNGNDDDVIVFVNDDDDGSDEVDDRGHAGDGAQNVRHSSVANETVHMNHGDGRSNAVEENLDDDDDKKERAKVGEGKDGNSGDDDDDDEVVAEAEGNFIIHFNGDSSSDNSSSGSRGRSGRGSRRRRYADNYIKTTKVQFMCILLCGIKVSLSHMFATPAVHMVEFLGSLSV